MDVLIVSKTKMQHGICVGAIEINSGRFVRLLDINGYHNESEDYEIRQIWSITYNKPINPRPLPHSEDICVKTKCLKEVLDENVVMRDFLNSMKIHIYCGSLLSLFETKLKFTNGGSCFVNKENVPQNSVCFWIPDRNLVRRDFNGKVRYNYNDGTRPWGYNVSYVGLIEPNVIIPRNTLVRMSLANWWTPEESDNEERCYLQLSGWYV